MKKKLFFKFFVLAAIAAFVTFSSCKNYDDDIDDLDKRISALKSELPAQLDAIKADLLSQMDAKIAAVNGEITALKTRLATLETNGATKAELAALKTEILSKTVSLEVYNTFKTKTEGDISTMQTKLGKLETDLTALTTVVGTKANQADLVALQDAIAAYKLVVAGELQTLQNSLTALGLRVGTLETALPALKKELMDALSDAVVALEGKIADLKGELKPRIDVLHAILDVKDGKSVVIADIFTKLGEQLDKITANEGDIKDLQIDLQAKYDALVLVDEDLQAQITANKGLIGDNKDAIDAINLYIDNTLEPRLDGIEDDIVTLNGKFDKLADEVAILNAQSNKLLRSLVLIPHHYVNGIEAIGFNPVKYLCNNKTWLANPNFVTVQYHVNPSSITEDMIDVDNLSFTYKLKENITRAAAINAKAKFVSLVDGILTVKVDLDANKAEMGGLIPGGKEKMDMIALQVPLSKKAKLGETEYDAIVTSDWARVDVDPMTNSAIDRLGHLCAEDNITYSGNYATVTAAKAETDPYLLELVYDQEYDLLKFVTSTALTSGVCGEFDPAKYGLEWNFDLLDENGALIKYVLTTNDTDQQEFIKLLDNQGKVKAKVYDATPGAGVTDAIGRTPIVRVQLKDPATSCVVTQGFVKIKWVKEQPRLDVDYPGQKADFSCDMIETENGYYSTMGLKIKTKWMNTNVMNALGTYYQEFIHNYNLDTSGLYDANGTALTWGVVVPNPDSQVGEPEVTDLFSVYLSSTCDVAKKSSFTGYVHYTDAVSGEVALTIKVTLDINMPNLTVAGHNNTYWQGGNNSSNVFEVNPVQFRTIPQINPTANYRTDLLNGFTNGTTYTDDISKIVKSSITGHTPCGVEFVFDAVALKTYRFEIDGVTYRSDITNPNLRVTTDGKELQFLNGSTWTTASFIEYTDPMPGLAHAGEAIYLDESGQYANAVGNSWPEKFAKALVGKKVPVKLAAKLCCETECDLGLSRDIRKFEVYFIPPMHINSTFTDTFEDWVIGGDYIKLDDAFTLTDFAQYLVANTLIDHPLDPNEKNRYTRSLWRYYEMNNVVWDVASATCNIDVVGGNLDVVPGTKKPLPENYLVTYVNTILNRNSLRFQNNSGAPLAKEFELYVPVTVGHKWGTLSTTVTIKVLPPQ